MGQDQIDIDVPGFSPLPGIAAHPAEWAALSRRFARRPWLTSEGVRTILGPPQIAHDPLLARCREVVARIDAFFRKAIDAYYDGRIGAGEYLINEAFAKSIDRDTTTKTPIPIGRLDCVLTTDGSLRVVELNTNGVCISHLSNVMFLARALAGAGRDDDARMLDEISSRMVEAFRRSHEETSSRPKDRPSVGVVLPGRRWLKGMNILFRGAFERRGMRYVFASFEDLEIRASGISILGEPVDVLWADLLVYFAYQYVRYRQTKFPTKIGDYDNAPEAALRILEDPRFDEHVREGRLAVLSPMRSYLALSKHLLSWVDRPELGLGGDERTWLHGHLARTYSGRDRSAGLLSFDEAVRAQRSLVLKPCQYGGAHGVSIGLEMTAEQWAKDLERIWEDREWILQAYYAPIAGRAGTISVGLYTYGGRLGGITLRAAPSLVVSARDSMFISVVD